MTRLQLVRASARYYWRAHAAVALGVACAVAVVSGSAVVGVSVRASLETIARSRLGRAEVVVAAEQPFTVALADRLSERLGPAQGAGGGPAPGTSRRVAPLLALTGTVRHESSGLRAAGIQVYGVDDGFFELHGVDDPGVGIRLSRDLIRELSAAPGDAVLLRVTRPTDIPLDSLHGRRDEGGRALRVEIAGELGPDRMGDFSVAPGQGPVRAAFLPLAALQDALDLSGRANTLLVAAPSGMDRGALADEVRTALRDAVWPADLGVSLRALDLGRVAVESASGLVPDAIADASGAAASAAGLSVSRVLTWLATSLTVGTRTIPYSLVSAVEAGLAGAPAALARSGDPPPIVLSEWAATELSARDGDLLALEYFRWADEGRLVTERTTLQVAGRTPMRGLAVDAHLAPDYPGISDARGFGDWDPPFPIDLRRVRPQDEAYWDRYRTAPKAFIPLEAGQRLWRSRYGGVTSLRVEAASGPVDTAALERGLRAALDPVRAGLQVVDVGAQNRAASAGATDFGAYFSYFSFFLMVSALIVAGLFFRLGIEARMAQVGVLRAAGFTVRDVTWWLAAEGAFVAALGAVAGAALAVAWAALMVHGLGTWWVGAVGTTALTLHVDPAAIALGAAATFLAAMAAIAATARGLGRESPRALVTGTGRAVAPRAAAGRPSAARAAAPASVAGGAAVLAAGAAAAGLLPAAAGFFGAGALTLVAGLLALRAALVYPRAGRSLALANASWRPGRSLAVAGLVAAAAFLLVSVDSFRKRGTNDRSPGSGTGGFSLFAQSTVPIVHDLSTTDGRTAAGLPAGDPALATLEMIGFRLREGDDASCLNLYRPAQPRLLGVSEAFIGRGRFRFAAVAAVPEPSNPWRLLGQPDRDGVVPAIVDATSLAYVLHARVGDEITIDTSTARPVRLRIVAALADSVLQSEILVHEQAILSLYPGIAGYQVFLAATADDAADRAAAAVLEDALADSGLDVESTGARLARFHEVENTYLSTFQALGGLGLMLGVFGLVAVILRNALERRRELALLAATGYTSADLRRLVAAEHLALVVIGLAIGVGAAGIAIAPVLWARGGGVPVASVAWVLPVLLTGAAATYGATARVRRMALAASLRSE
jgi:ABC-type lipoprotein release transport system permease subunit